MEPAECLFADDSSAKVRMARSLGIREIRFQGSEELRQELGMLGIRPVSSP